MLHNMSMALILVLLQSFVYFAYYPLMSNAVSHIEDAPITQVMVWLKH